MSPFGAVADNCAPGETHPYADCPTCSQVAQPMRRFDRYLIREMAGPFVFGLGAFLIVTVGIDLIYRALDLIMSNGLPAVPVL
jgi:hypothetical protein